MRPNIRKPRVLVIEDDPTVRRLVVAALADGAMDAVQAGDGAEALRLIGASAEPFDLIVLDIQMPVMDGETFFARLRADGDHTPVLILSAFGARAAARRLGAEGSMGKPFDIDAFVALAARLAGSASEAGDADATAC
jgi:DNA-binding response OmpR family regulator